MAMLVSSSLAKHVCCHQDVPRHQQYTEQQASQPARQRTMFCTTGMDAARSLSKLFAAMAHQHRLDGHENPFREVCPVRLRSRCHCRYHHLYHCYRERRSVCELDWQTGVVVGTLEVAVGVGPSVVAVAIHSRGCSWLLLAGDCHTQQNVAEVAIVTIEHRR